MFSSFMFSFDFPVVSLVLAFLPLPLPPSSSSCFSVFLYFRRRFVASSAVMAVMAVDVVRYGDEISKFVREFLWTVDLLIV
ncbi:hypothetical protein FPQ18DRAFT_358607, partial [Pyronema domesticum]